MNENDPLGELLRAEAADSVPSYSPQLHRQIMQSIDRAPGRSNSLVLRLLTWTAAAALVGVVIGIEFSHRPQAAIARSPSIHLAVQLDPIAWAGQDADQWGRMPLVSFHRDATDVAEFFSRQLQSLPSCPTERRM